MASATDAHRQLINVLEDRTGLGVTTGNGTVQVNLGQLIRQVGTELGLPASAVSKLPPNAGVITVMRSDQLGLAQTGVRAIRILSVWLLVLVLALFGLAVYLAEGVRRQTLRNIGWAFVVVGLIVFVARRLTGDYVIGGLTTSTYQTPAQHIWVIGTSTLGEIGWATVLYGVLIVLGAGLAGPTRAATAVRAWIAPVVNQRPGIAWAGVAVAFLLVVLWGGTYALRTPLGIIILGGLLAAGFYAFRRQTQREFPNGPNAATFAPRRWPRSAALASLCRLGNPPPAGGSDTIDPPRRNSRTSPSCMPAEHSPTKSSRARRPPSWSDGGVGRRRARWRACAVIGRPGTRGPAARATAPAPHGAGR